ncbi:flavodoxin family protein [Ruminococcaceae bacterium OttesenSCG-928-L11]|nr:flavodoxin family protein [Ruminococcaceae bacterium OttesenSCG-928-L11]
MAIVVIWASPDKEGLTASAKNNAIEGIHKAGREVKEIHLNQKKIQSCLACGKGGYVKCLEKGNCILNDDFDSIYTALCQAETIVFITPVYWHDLSENFKALFDRLRRCETAHNGFLKEKRYLAVACAGGYGLGVTDCLVHMETTLSHMGMKALDRIPVVRFNQAYMIPAIREAAYSLALFHNEFSFDDFKFS